MIYVYSDAGHGGTDSGAVGGKDKEKDANLKLDTIFSKEMAKDVTVFRTRTTDTYISLGNRATAINIKDESLRSDKKGHISAVVSHHLNAFNKQASGIEVCYASEKGRALAQCILDELWATGIFKINRGLKYRPGLYMLRKPAAPAVIIEYGFIDNDAERKRVLPGLDILAKASARGTKKFLKIKDSSTPDKPVQPDKPTEENKPTVSSYSIFAKPRCDISQMQNWAKSKKATDLFISLAPTFYDVAVRNGIDPAVVYAQSAKETGYMKFGGVLDASFKNPCGLKTPAGGGDKDPNAHTRFESWDQGIEAQVDHLGLYAGGSAYPKRETPDPRHFPYILGKAKTVEELSGKWAPSKSYGTDIIKMVKEIQATKSTNSNDIYEKDKPSGWAKEAWDYVEKEGLMSGNPKGTLTRQEFAVVLKRLHDK